MDYDAPKVAKTLEAYRISTALGYTLSADSINITVRKNTTIVYTTHSIERLLGWLEGMVASQPDQKEALNITGFRRGIVDKIEQTAEKPES